MSTTYSYTAHSVDGSHNNDFGEITSATIEEAVAAVKKLYSYPVTVSLSTHEMKNGNYVEKKLVDHA